jgi:anti-sigma factor (TIGR02949 family)
VNEPRPDQPVCSCRDLESMLAAYVDGEAPSCDCDKVRAHVEACPPCRERLSGERGVREAIRAHRDALRAAAPEALKTRCASLVAQRARDAVRNQDRVLRRWVPLSLAATLFLAVAVVFGFGLTNKVQALAVQTTIDHVTCTRLKGEQLLLDAGDAARNWESRFGWRISVPASSSEAQLQFKGVRRCVVADGRVAHIIYSWLGEPLSVYVLPKQTLPESAQFVHRFRHNSIMWSKNDRTYVVVTTHRRDPALEQMVAYVKATAY